MRRQEFAPPPLIAADTRAARAAASLKYGKPVKAQRARVVHYAEDALQR